METDEESGAIGQQQYQQALAVKQRQSLLKDFIHRTTASIQQGKKPHLLTQHAKQPAVKRPTPAVTEAQKKQLSLALSSKKVQLCNRTEMVVNSEMRNVLRAQGKHIKELYDDYQVTMAKRTIQEQGYRGDNFDIRVEGGGNNTATISLTQTNTGPPGTQHGASPDQNANARPAIKHESSKTPSQFDKTKTSLGSPREPQIGNIPKLIEQKSDAVHHYHHNAGKKPGFGRNDRLNTQEHELLKANRMMVLGQKGVLHANGIAAGPAEAMLQL